MAKEVKEVMEAKEEAFKRDKIKRYIYIGPTLKNGQYKFGKITKDLPKDLEDYFTEQPGLKALFVESTNLSEAKAQLNAETSALKAIYQDISKWAKEGGK